MFVRYLRAMVFLIIFTFLVCISVVIGKISLEKNSTYEMVAKISLLESIKILSVLVIECQDYSTPSYPTDLAFGRFLKRRDLACLKKFKIQSFAILSYNWQNKSETV